MKLQELLQYTRTRTKETLLITVPCRFFPPYQKFYKRIYTKGYLSLYELKKSPFNSQYGFRKGHSTNQAILEFVSKVVDSLEVGNHLLCVFLDLSKAFDTIDHEILLYKLEIYGVKGIALDWFRNYLTDCKPYTEIENFRSDSQ